MTLTLRTDRAAGARYIEVTETDDGGVAIGITESGGDSAALELGPSERRALAAYLGGDR